MPVTGIGGVFFRAKDPQALARWYREHLRVIFEDYAPWNTAAGPTLIAPFDESTDHFPAAKQWMINFRVSELDRLITDLREAGIDVTTDAAWDTPETGRFARIADPEGNAVELWEPPSS